MIIIITIYLSKQIIFLIQHYKNTLIMQITKVFYVWLENLVLGNLANVNSVSVLCFLK